MAEARERALLVWNPAAGRAPERMRRRAERLALALRQGGWAVASQETVPIAGAVPAAERGLNDNYSVLIAAGGDGTLQEIANVIARAAPAARPRLAVVPWGTANIFAGASGCPRSPPAAARWLLAARTRAAPLGHAIYGNTEQYFLSVASVGIDAAVVHRLDAEAKRRWGKLAYLAEAAKAWKSYFPAPIEFTINGRAATADGLILGLTRFYGGRLRLGTVTPGESIALALRGAPRLLPWQALYLGVRSLERAPGVERLAESGIYITSSGRPMELDGEAAGFTPVSLEVIPNGVQILA